MFVIVRALDISISDTFEGMRWIGPGGTPEDLRPFMRENEWEIVQMNLFAAAQDESESTEA